MKIAILETQVERLLEKQKELTERVRANEKVVAAIGLLGSIAIAVIGAGYFAPSAEACSPRLDGEPTYCPDFDDVLVREFEETITDKSFDEEFPDYYDQYEVTIFDTRDNDSSDIAHMGHSFPTGEWIEKLRNWESRRKRTPIEDMINNTLTEYENGSNGSTEQEELLQLPSSINRQSTGRRYDRCHHRSWIRFIQERTGKNCRSGYTREEN